MAADTRAYAGFNGDIGQKRKIRRFGNGTLIGVSTNQVGAGELIMDWYIKGAKKPVPELPEDIFTMLVVKPNGEAYYANNSFLIAGPLTGEYFAIGSGSDYAQGAMAMGASAEQAVEIAARFDVWSGAPIITLGHTE